MKILKDWNPEELNEINHHPIIETEKVEVSLNYGELRVESWEWIQKYHDECELLGKMPNQRHIENHLIKMEKRINFTKLKTKIQIVPYLANRYELSIFITQN